MYMMILKMEQQRNCCTTKKGDFPQSFHTEADGVNKQSLESWEIVLADEGEKRRRGKEKIPISMSHHMGF